MRLQCHLSDLWPVVFSNSEQDIPLALLCVYLEQVNAINSLVTHHVGNCSEVTYDTFADQPFSQQLIEHLVSACHVHLTCLPIVRQECAHRHTLLYTVRIPPRQ